MTPARPYLLRALYEWITDNHLTPYIVVNADIPGVDVPQEYIENGKIIFNISKSAVQDLQITNQVLEFHATFSGVPMEIFAPVKAIEAIYAQENNRGMAFSPEEDEDETPLPPRKKEKSGKPNLKIVE